MNANLSAGSSAIRELTADEINDVAGAARITIGPVYIGVGEDGVVVTAGIKGVMNVTVFGSGGICGRIAGLGGGCM
jgi:predicted phage tail protein